MAGPSAQEGSSSMSRCSYHVFLSFRGADTRYTFTDHLYTALKYAGFQIFRDDEGIERGGHITHEIEKAIHDSKMSVIVFSKDYASSEFCLDEVVMIKERRSVGHVVIPLFYHVDPSEVAEQSGSFKEAFTKHEREQDKDRVNGWRAALKEVAVLAGDVLKDGYEAKFIQDIVKKVSSKLNRTVLHVPSCLIGIDSFVRDINSWLEDGSNCAAIAVIYGIGGAGKTTIAKTVYNMNFDKFEGRSFLADVRETSGQFNGVVQLQRQLIYDILKGIKSKIHNVHEGTIRIKEALQNKKVLIVLDDVDQLEQFKEIIGMKDWLFPGSKIVITTRHEQLLNTHEDCKMFRVKELNDSESLQLFSWHAFRTVHPNIDYMEYSKRAVQNCGGLPLALEIFGSCLSGRSIDFWKRALREPEAVDDGKIQRILRISYDSLQDVRDKNLFLDVACFFLGKDKDYVDSVLESCDFYKVLGIQNLIDRYLITINECNKLMMHQLLRNMAREIVRQESPEELGKRSRLWRYEDALTVLRETTGTKIIRSLILNQHPINKASRKKVDLKTKAFAKMSELKLLEINFMSVAGDYKQFPKSLIWLSFHGFPLASIPTNFDLEKLVVLEMRNSSLQHAWKGTKTLPKLKIFDLSHSHFLISTPDFTKVTGLERLMLEDCIQLAEVDESIGVLEQLVFFNLKDCRKLKKLSSNIGMLKSLETLILSGCLELNELPDALTELKSLRELYTDGIGINQFHSTFGNMLKVRLLSLAFLPCSLVKLSLADCNIPDSAIPNDFGSFASLQYLNLSGNSFSTLPESMRSLTKLESLLLERCSELQSLPNLPTSLEELKLKDCPSLERITNLPNLLTSLRLNLLGCKNLVEVQGLFKLEPIQDIHAKMIKNLKLFDCRSLDIDEVEIKRCISILLRNDMTITRRKTSIQVLHEFGIFNIFFHGSEIPNWYHYQSKGSEVSFNVPNLNTYIKRPLNSIVWGFNLCVVYHLSTRDFEEEAVRNSPYIIIRNETKGLKWIYSPMFYQETYISDPLANLWGIHGPSLWLSHWTFVGDQMELGDYVTVSVVMTNGFYVEQCGIHIVDKLEEYLMSQLEVYGILMEAIFLCIEKLNDYVMENLSNDVITFLLMVRLRKKNSSFCNYRPSRIKVLLNQLKIESKQVYQRLMNQLEGCRSFAEELQTQGPWEESNSLRNKLCSRKKNVLNELKADCAKRYEEVYKICQWYQTAVEAKEAFCGGNVPENTGEKLCQDIFYQLKKLQNYTNQLEECYIWCEILAHADVSAYQVAPHVYFLCHWENRVHQHISRYGLDKLSQYHRLYQEMSTHRARDL